MDGVEIRVADPAGPDATRSWPTSSRRSQRAIRVSTRANQPPAPLDAFTTPRGGVFLIATLADDACRVRGHAAARCRSPERCGACSSARPPGATAQRGHCWPGSPTRLDLGYERLRLDTGDRLPEAVQLFRTAGFRDIDDYNGNPYAAHWMELTL